MPEIKLIQETDQFFIKFFLLDTSINLNNWGVTKQALRENLSTFIGKPFILIPDTFNHPDAIDGDDLLIKQEAFRVGDITSVGIEEETGKAWGIAEIHDKKAQIILKNGEVNFVSPSIVFNELDVIVENGIELATKFEGAHVASVKDPAYSIQKAQIKGKCSGSEKTCTTQLHRVQASISCSKCLKFLHFRKGNVSYILKASPCLEECLGKKKKPITDQDIAICLNECGESNKAAKCLVDMLGNCVTEGNIDPTSLKNITVIDLLKKKKSSLKKNSKKSKTMTIHEEDKDKKESQEDEEEEKKDAQEEEEEEKKDSQEDEEEKEEAQEDEEKEKDIDKAVKALRVELKSLKSQLKKSSKKAEVSPIVDKIVQAKLKLGHIKEAESAAESRKLFELPTSTLNAIATEYEKISPQDRPYHVLQRSASMQTQAGDDFLIQLGGSLDG